MLNIQCRCVTAVRIKCERSTARLDNCTVSTDTCSCAVAAPHVTIASERPSNSCVSKSSPMGGRVEHQRFLGAGITSGADFRGKVSAQGLVPFLKAIRSPSATKKSEPDGINVSIGEEFPARVFFWPLIRHHMEFSSFWRGKPAWGTLRMGFIVQIAP